MRVTFGADTINAGETFAVLGENPTWNGTRKKAVIFCHGAGDKAKDPLLDQYALLANLAADYTLLVADLGGDTWANDTGIARVASAVAYLRSSWGATGKVGLIGMSMGAAVALAYARANQADVACVAGVIPLTNIADIMTRDASFPAAVNAAYSGAYSDTTHGPTHSPIKFATGLGTIPIQLWTASNDPYTPNSVAQAFVTARGANTVLSGVGALGHTDAAVTAAQPGIAYFIRQNL